MWLIDLKIIIIGLSKQWSTQNKPQQIYKLQNTFLHIRSSYNHPTISNLLDQFQVHSSQKQINNSLNSHFSRNMNLTQPSLQDNFLPTTETGQLAKFGESIEWENLTDQDLLSYQKHLFELADTFDILQEFDNLEETQNQNENNSRPLLEPFRFKDIFFDFLQGQNHKITYLGKSTSTHQVQTQTIKLFVSILFKIGQQEKTFYPHLLTHIKEQFYKPNIFEKENLPQSTKQNYSILIDYFFTEAQQTSSYDDFIELNPEFENICVSVFRKITLQQTKRTQIWSSTHHSNQIHTKTFQMVQKFCSKFMVEMNHFLYDQPPIEMIALANQQRFVFLNESNHLFLLTLEKFDLLTVRRKSSHNISVHEKGGEKDLKRSSHDRKQKKNSWSELEGTAHFRTGQASEHLRDFVVLNVIDSDQTSNYESSVLKSQSKMHQLSDESTPKFKNSSIAHIRKKSHKDSFGGVDYDNMVYKDLANPKRYADQKGQRQRDRHGKGHSQNNDTHNKKVLSQRFETHQLESLTYVDDQESSIEFVPHFQTNEGPQKGKSMTVFGNNPTSPAYSNNNYSSFTGFAAKFQFEQNKAKLLKKMKGSNIEKGTEFYYNEEEIPDTVPQFKQQNSNSSQGNLLRNPHTGSRLLASSQIIEFTGGLDEIDVMKTGQKMNDDDDNQDFLIIPSMRQRSNHISERDERDNEGQFAQKEVFMSFSKNDKQKFIIPDSHQSEGPGNGFTLKAQPCSLTTLPQLQDSGTNNPENANSTRTRKYSYHTQKEERQNFRNKQRLEHQTELSQPDKSFISEHSPEQSVKKPKYRKYHETNNAQNFMMFNQYESASQIGLKNSHTFTNQPTSDNKNDFRLQRKHSSNIPVYKAAQKHQQNNLKQSKHPEVTHNQNSRNVHYNKRFEENSVRFSQVIDHNEDEIFYVQKQQKDQSRQSFGNRKQRKVTDFYESPLVNLAKVGNRSSQIIENGSTSNKTHNQTLQNRFQGHLDISHDHSNILINSGGGKNYSVISNISYDEQKRIEDLLEIQNHHAMINHETNNLEGNNFGQFSDQQVDFANIQAIQRLIVKKKQQKIKIKSQSISVSIPPTIVPASQPQGWIKKEVFYFFESGRFSSRTPEKHVIHNPERFKQKTVRQGNQPNSKNNQRINDLPSSSTSLYNFCTSKKENPEFQRQKDQSISNKSLGDRKYSVNEIKPVSDVNFNPDHTLNGQKTISPPYVNSQRPVTIRYQQDWNPHTRNDFDKVSIYTQPLPQSNVRKSPSQKPELVKFVNESSHRYLPQSINSVSPNLKTYPSQPTIRFTIGNNSQRNVPQPQYQSINTAYQTPNQIPLYINHSQRNLQTYQRIQY